VALGLPPELTINAPEKAGKHSAVQVSLCRVPAFHGVKHLSNN